MKFQIGINENKQQIVKGKNVIYNPSKYRTVNEFISAGNGKKIEGKVTAIKGKGHNHYKQFMFD